MKFIVFSELGYKISHDVIQHLKRAYETSHKNETLQFIVYMNDHASTQFKFRTQLSK